MYDLARDVKRQVPGGPPGRATGAFTLPPAPADGPRTQPDDVRIAPGRGRAATANVRRHLARASLRVGALVAADVLALATTFALARLLAAVQATAEVGASVARLFEAAGGATGWWEPAAVMIVALAASGSYGRGDRRRDPARLVLGAALGVALLAWVAQRTLPGAGAPHAATLLLAAAPVLAGRLLLDRGVRGLRRLRASGRGAPRVLFVGRGADCLEAMGRSAFDVEAGAEIAGVVDVGAGDSGNALVAFERALDERGVDTVVICGQLDEVTYRRLIKVAIAAECEVLAAVRTFEINGVRPSVVWRSGQPLIELRAVALRGQQLFLKRLLDVAGAAVLCVLLSPSLLAIGLAVRLDSRGPAVFGQRRLGRHGRMFRCFKFRSMHADAEQRLRDDPELHAEYIRNDFKLAEDRDPRITRVGRFLRKTSLDELPQLWNVLRGDMSLVGPRPIVPDELRHYGGEEPLFLSLRPGITGAWQVAGRSNLAYPGRATVELDYVQGWTLWSDLRILALTVPAVLCSAARTEMRAGRRARRTAARAAVVAVAACVLAGPSAVGAVGGSAEPPRSRAHYAAPDGRADGTGAPDRPWDLATALAGAGGRVRPGDVVWVRGGTYRGKFRSTLVGSARTPVVVRAVHGERATIEGRLRVDGSDVTVWGLEIRQSGAGDEPGLYALAPGGRYVNLVIHDAGENGVSLRSESGFTELYGCIVYDNGDDEHLDQGVYAPNDAGEKRITDNVFFNNMASGIQVYVTAKHPLLTNVRVEGNISFNNSSIAPAISEENATVGGATVTERVAIVGNVLYFAGVRGHNLRFGLEGKDNRDVVVRDNYVVGGATVVRTENFARAVVENNTFVGAARLVRIGGASLAGHRWAGNVHYRDPSARAWSVNGKSYDFAGWRAATGLGATDRAVAAPPSAPKVFVRPNRYEPGRANIAVVNWGRAPAVNADVSDVLRVGDRWELRNVQDVFGPPVARGTYGGRTIRIPMSGVRPPAARGRPGTPSRTAPDFDAFLLTSPDRAVEAP